MTSDNLNESKINEKELLYDDIKTIISKIARIDKETISDKSSLRDELNIDSMLAIQIASQVEEKFDVKFDEVEIFNVDNIEEIADIILEYKGYK